MTTGPTDAVLDGVLSIIARLKAGTITPSTSVSSRNQRMVMSSDVT
jgi:hypothetical protein